MRNYASKSLKRVTRYRTPSTFKMKATLGPGKAKMNPPNEPPGRGYKTNKGRA